MQIVHKPIIYRDYVPGDEHQILSLFRLAFHKETSYAFWRWRFVDNPSGRGIIKMTFDGNTLVGHASAIPMKVLFRGKLYNAIFPMTVMTHPEYGGRGIISRLLTSVYSTGAENGFTLAYGFFNDNVLGICRDRLGYGNIVKMSPLEKKLDFSHKEEPSGKNVVRTQLFDDRIDRLWEKVRDDYPIIVPRTKENLNWRFVRYSEGNYPKFLFSNGGGYILGYVILKIYKEGSTVRGHIIDLLSIPDEMVIKSLINKALGFFAEKGIADISCWMMENSFYTPYFLAEGFLRHAGATNFGAKLLHEGDKEHLEMENPAGWHITMGDSDVF